MSAILEDNVCNTIVKNDLCIGCGVCAGICPTKNLTMGDSPQGGYIPISDGRCLESCAECFYVCPFQDNTLDEDAMGKRIFGSIPEIRYTKETGFYLKMYIGHVGDPKHRWQAASGGMATWFLETLLRQGFVDYVICVTPFEDASNLFKFSVFSHPKEIRRSAKSAYYPVELSQVIQYVVSNDGRYALIGLPCFIKAIRLAACRNAKLRKRLVFFAGLTCGEIKTKAFAETLAREMKIDSEKITQLQFRDKSTNKTPLGFSIKTNVKKHLATDASIRFYALAWLSGMFKPRSCTLCDDIFAELADITFMDAWLPEYVNEKDGTNLIIVRSEIAERIVRQKGILEGDCRLDEIPAEKVIESQAAVIKTKRDDLSHRIWIKSHVQQAIPRKRVVAKRPSMLDRMIIRNTEAIRIKSYHALYKQRLSGEAGVRILMKEMRLLLFLRKWLPRFKKEKWFKAKINVES